MSPIAAFVLGLLVGWLVEWVVDLLYWRRRYMLILRSAKQCQQQVHTLEAELQTQVRMVADGDQQLAALKGELAVLQMELESWKSRALEAPARAVEPVETEEAPPAGPPTPDDLLVIKGIGPVIAGRLNRAGITTFEQLAAMNAVQLRELLGDIIQRLSDEETILEQARQFAHRKQAGGK